MRQNLSDVEKEFLKRLSERRNKMSSDMLRSCSDETHTKIREAVWEGLMEDLNFLETTRNQ